MTRNLLSLLVVTATAAVAQDQPPVLSLSLKRAVEIALAPDGNTRVQLAAQTVRVAEARSAGARSALLPNIDGTAGYQNFTRNLQAFGLTFPPGVFPFTINPIVGPIDVYDLRFNATTPVLDFVAIRRLQAARTAVRAAKAEAQGTNDQIASLVARLYLSAERAQASVETAQANVTLSEELVRLATNQKNAGTGTGIEVVRAQSQLANDRQRLEVATNDLDRARLNLLKALGLRLDGTVELVDRMKYTPADAVAPEEAVRTAIQKRPDIEAQRERESAARLSYSSVKAERLPSLSAMGDYGTIGASSDHLLPTHTFALSMRVPIWTGGRREARQAESAAQYRQEQIRSVDVRQQAELETRQAIDAIRSAQAQVAAAQEGLKLADQELAQARRRYEAGVTTSIEVTDAQARLQRARDNVTAALFNYNVAQLDLHSATGTIQEFVGR